MKKYVQITIECENAAFDEGINPASEEIARILKLLAADIRISGVLRAPGNLRDINGNTVGAFSVGGDWEE